VYKLERPTIFEEKMNTMCLDGPVASFVMMGSYILHDGDDFSPMKRRGTATTSTTEMSQQSSQQHPVETTEGSNTQSTSCFSSNNDNDRSTTLDESKAATTTMSLSSSVSTLPCMLIHDAPAQDVWSPECWCAEFEETLNNRPQQSKSNDDGDDNNDDVSELSEETDLIYTPPTHVQATTWSTLKPNATSEKRNRPSFRTQKSRSNHHKKTSTFQYSVQFTQITVRKYPIILGENPGCSCGPSLSIGWEYHEHPSLSVDDFESLRARFRDSNNLVLPRATRELLLRRMGYSAADIAEAVRRDNQTRAQRRQTISNMTMVEAIVQAKSKVLGGWFSATF